MHCVGEVVTGSASLAAEAVTLQHRHGQTWLTSTLRFLWIMLLLWRWNSPYATSQAIDRPLNIDTTSAWHLNRDFD